MNYLPPFLPIAASSLLHHGKDPLSAKAVTLSFLLFALPPHSILALWRCLIGLARKWTTLPGIHKIVPQTLIHGGPLGPGCGKVVEVLVGCLLWNIMYSNEELPIELGPLPSLRTWLVVLILSAMTNIVLSLWSRHASSRGDHTGVHTMVESSRGRTLSIVEHFKLVLWALVNALCEEVASRGLWMQEFERRGGGQLMSSSSGANVLQALSFGVWHFHGIPSGWTGVGLTFVYGLGMGFLKEHGGGLLLPIVAHTIADYFIFAVIARRGGFQR